MINYNGQGYPCLGSSLEADLSGMGGHQICLRGSVGVVGHLAHRQKVVLSSSLSTSHYSPVGRVNDKPIWPEEAVSESRANDQRQPRVSSAVIQPGSDR